MKLRLTWGLPPVTVGILVLLIFGPLYLIGRKAWWVTPLMLAVGWWLALHSKDDPDFLQTWGGELKLKDRYR